MIFLDMASQNTPSHPPPSRGRCQTQFEPLSRLIYRPFTSPLMGEAGRGWGQVHRISQSQNDTSPLGGEVELRSNSGEGAFLHAPRPPNATPSHARFPADAPRANLAAAREVKE